MKFSNLIKIALTAIKRNKMRSFLTMLGIVIGVAAVIAMLAIGQGSNASIRSTISSMGTNLINVMPASQNKGGVHQGRAASPTLVVDDVTYLKNHSALIDAVSPEMDGSGQIVYGSNNWPTTIYSGNEDYVFIKKYEVKTGRIYNSKEIKNADKVCLVGQTIIENIFTEDENPIGKTIRFNNIPFKIIGILKEKGDNTFGQDQDDMILAPYTTVMKRLFRQPYLRAIVVSARSEELITETSAEITELLRLSHKLSANEDDDFEIRTQEELISNFSSISEKMLVLLGSIAAISLIVGGIGIMNIMYVTVTERTREIGLRMAIGGKAIDILRQFLLEAMLLSIIGGIIGVGMGVLASNFVEKLLDWPILITSNSIVLSFLFCTFIGIFFGWYPARMASSLNPIEALRHE
jgi:putative ABC transport system permease protein